MAPTFVHYTIVLITPISHGLPLDPPPDYFFHDKRRKVGRTQVLPVDLAVCGGCYADGVRGVEELCCAVLCCACTG